MLQLRISDYIVPPPTIAVDHDLTAARSSTEELRSLADSAAQLAVFREALTEQSENFERLFREIEQGDPSPAQLEEATEFIRDHEKSAASALLPAIEELDKSLAKQYRPSQFVISLRRLAEEAIDAVQTWLEIYQNLRIRLLKLASDRRVAAGETGSAVLSDGAEMEAYLRRIAGG